MKSVDSSSGVCQVQLVYGLWCRWSQIFSVFDQMQSRRAQRASAGFPESSRPPLDPRHPSTAVWAPSHRTPAPTARQPTWALLQRSEVTHIITSNRLMRCIYVWVLYVCINIYLTIYTLFSHTHFYKYLQIYKSICFTHIFQININTLLKCLPTHEKDIL